MASHEQTPPSTPSDLWTIVQRLEQETAWLRGELERQQAGQTIPPRRLLARHHESQGPALSRARLLQAAGAAAAGLAGTALVGSRSALAANPPPPPSGLITPFTPIRVLDTRSALGVSTTTPIPSGQTITLALAGTNGIPSDAIGIVANLTGVTPTGAGFLSIYPTGSVTTLPPTTSNLNLSPAGAYYAIANAVTVSLGSGSATIYVYVAGSGTSHVLLDLFGYIE